MNILHALLLLGCGFENNIGAAAIGHLVQLAVIQSD